MMASTVSSIAYEVLTLLEPMVSGRDMIGKVVTDSGTSLTVTGPVGVDGKYLFEPGLIEVGNELIVANEFNTTTGVFSNLVRGHLGSTTATHSAGVPVRLNPKIPYRVVANAVRDTVAGLYPRVPVVKWHSFNYEWNKVRYSLPDDVRKVLAVQVQAYNFDEYVPSRRWSFDPYSVGLPSPTDSATKIQVWDGSPGYGVNVLYVCEPVALTSDADTLATAGYAEWVREVVVLGTAARVTGAIDLGNAWYTTIKQDTASSWYTSASEVLRQAAIPEKSYTGTDLSKYFFALYAAKMDDVEQRAKSLLPPVAAHYLS